MSYFALCCRAFSAEAKRDDELSDEEVTMMSYEPKLDETQQTQLPQLSAIASNKIREIAKICNAQLKADKVSNLRLFIYIVLKYTVLHTMYCVTDCL